jgi:hypothetical protein
MKEYMTINGTVYGPNGLTLDLCDEFINKLIELAESHGFQLAVSFELKSEDEL